MVHFKIWRLQKIHHEATAIFWIPIKQNTYVSSVSILLNKSGLKENNAILAQVSYSKHELADIFAQVSNTPSSSSTSSSSTTLSVAEIQSIFEEKEKIDLNWAVDKVSRRKYAKCCTCQERLQKERSLSPKGYYIPPNQTFAIERTFYFCLTKSFVLRKPFLSTIAVPPQSVSNASFATLTKEDIDIIGQRGFNILQHVFFVLSFFCSFLFLIWSVCDMRDSVNS